MNQAQSRGVTEKQSGVALILSDRGIIGETQQHANAHRALSGSHILPDLLDGLRENSVEGQKLRSPPKLNTELHQDAGRKPNLAKIAPASGEAR